MVQRVRVGTCVRGRYVCALCYFARSTSPPARQLYFAPPPPPGGFIYVATVDVLPALLQGDCGFKQTMAELAAMGAGISMMLVVLALESGH